LRRHRRINVSEKPRHCAGLFNFCFAFPDAMIGGKLASFKELRSCHALQLPTLSRPLTRSEQSFSCSQRHQFDIAKEGYVNLLPVQHKRSRDPGDSAEMMQARRAFLDAGHYQPLRDAIALQLQMRLSAPAEAILDIGCGEGTTPSPLPA
jgi:hypothetical protein